MVGMIFASALQALSDITSPAFRGALVKTLVLTSLFLVGTWFALLETVQWLVGTSVGGWLTVLPDWTNPEAWAGGLGVVGSILAGIALAFGLAFLIAPVSAVVAGLFLDDAAAAIEERDYPDHEPGRALPLPTAIIMALRFFGVVIVVNLFAFVLLWFVPGVNIAAFLLVNGYLLGREFFDFAAMRQRPIHEARALRRRNSGTVLLAGAIIACVLAVPIVNLVTPLFGAAMMVHLHKRVAERDRLVENTPLGASLRLGRDGISAADRLRAPTPR